MSWLPFCLKSSLCAQYFVRTVHQETSKRKTSRINKLQYSGKYNREYTPSSPHHQTIQLLQTYKWLVGTSVQVYNCTYWYILVGKDCESCCKILTTGIEMEHTFGKDRLRARTLFHHFPSDFCIFCNPLYAFSYIFAICLHLLSLSIVSSCVY